MRSETLLALAEQCQRSADEWTICEVSRQLYPDEKHIHTRCDELLNASAWIEAALSLMPDKWAWRRFTHSSVTVYRQCPSVKAVKGFLGCNENPGLAMAAAILFAKADSLAISERAVANA